MPTSIKKISKKKKVRNPKLSRSRSRSKSRSKSKSKSKLSKKKISQILSRLHKIEIIPDTNCSY